MEKKNVGSQKNTRAKTAVESGIYATVGVFAGALLDKGLDMVIKEGNELSGITLPTKTKGIVKGAVIIGTSLLAQKHLPVSGNISKFAGAGMIGYGVKSIISGISPNLEGFGDTEYVDDNEFNDKPLRLQENIFEDDNEFNDKPLRLQENIFEDDNEFNDEPLRLQENIFEDDNEGSEFEGVEIQEIDETTEESEDFYEAVA